MTRREAERRNKQEAALCALGFTVAEAEQLRRISMTLHRWHEGECGTDRACLVRGCWDQATQNFEYADDGLAYWEYAGLSGRRRYQVTQDRETGAKRRLAAIMAGHPPLQAYIQTDPRGCALYIIRPGDVPEGADVSSCYNNGLAVY